MPVNGEQCASFLGIKGENCSFLKIRGVKILEDEYGVDVLKAMRGGGNNSNVDVALSNLLGRIDTIEKYLQNMPPQIPGPRGEKGEKGDSGESIQGIQGARGKNGACTVQELTDVNLDGLDDGAILVWSAKQKKWVISLE